MMRRVWMVRRRSVSTMRRASISITRAGAWMALGALWAFGCREATSPFVSVDRPSIEVTGPLQLTFSGLDERAPVWLGPDSLAYVAEGVAPFAQSPGVLMKIAAAGGAAEPLLPALQFPGGRVSISSQVSSSISVLPSICEMRPKKDWRVFESPRRKRLKMAAPVALNANGQLYRLRNDGTM